MKNLREQAGNIFKHGVNIAVNKANQTGFVATARFTILADMMQIQCLYFENTDLLRFTLPVGLHSTVLDIAAHHGTKISTYKAESMECFTLVFDKEDDQDEFIKFFQLLAFRGARAYPTPDIYFGEPDINKEFCQELLGYLHTVVQTQHEGGWSRIR